MKTKKLISVFLVAVMLIVPVVVVANAGSAYSITQGPLKTVYTDGEGFNPQGLKLSNGSETIEYSPLDEKFKFDPAPNENLTVTVDENGSTVPTAVRVFYNNEYVATVNVTVSHIEGPLVSFGDSLKNGHGHYCEGCGKVLDREDHVINDWVPNDDEGFFLPQTETGTCEVCGQVVTRTLGEYDDQGNLVPGTDHIKFDDIFDFGSMTELEVKIITYVKMIVVSLVQAMVGIK